MELAVERRGERGPVLVLLHGAGTNGAVWMPLVEQLETTWPGRILIPDFRGHGRSPRAAAYGLGLHAADVAELLPADEKIYLAGHSMGGAVALILASGWFGVSVSGALAFSVKTEFDAAEREKAQTFARSPARRFPTRDDALERYVRVAGLTGLVEIDSPVAKPGIVARGGAFELAADPAGALVFGADIGAIFAAVRSPLLVATGERDEIAPAAELRRYAPDLRVIAGAGHNVQVEQPAVIAALIAELAG